MPVEARRDVFQAIADPTRRQIISMLAGNPMNLNAVAAGFDISRSAISQQIKILTDCGLVMIEQQGRERVCNAKPEALSEVAEWLEEYKQFWEARMDRFGALLQEVKKEKRSQIKRKKK